MVARRLRGGSIVRDVEIFPPVALLGILDEAVFLDLHQWKWFRNRKQQWRRSLGHRWNIPVLWAYLRLQHQVRLLPHISASQCLCHLWLAWLFCPSCVSPNSNCSLNLYKSNTPGRFFFFSVCVTQLNKLCQGEQVIRAQPMRQILVDELEGRFLSKLILTAG